MSRKHRVWCFPEEAQYRKFLRDTSWYKGANSESTAELAYLVLGLLGESGEAADVFKKAIRVSGISGEDDLHDVMSLKDRDADFVHELGDVLWYLVRILDVLGISLEQLMVLNTAKLYQRLLSAGEHSNRLRGEVEWPFSTPYEDALKLMRDIESQTTSQNASTSMGTDTA